MEPVWLRSYPPGVPAELDLDPNESLVTILERACRDFPDRRAFTNFGRAITYAQLDDLSRRFAAWLQRDAGLVPGDRVAIMMPNLLQYPIAMFGALRAGMVVVNVNPLYTPRELEHQLSNSGARVIVVVANSAATLAEIINDTVVEKVIVTQIGDLLGFPKRQVVNLAVRYIKRMVEPYRLPGACTMDEALRTEASAFKPCRVTGSDLACLQYTGGTTGRAKGARLSHGNLVANVRQVNTWFSSLVEKGQEIVVTALPLYHVYALTCNCFAYVDLGALNVLITDPRDTKGFIAEMRKWPFTCITGVNTLYQSLADHPDLRTVDFSSLKVVSAGGMAVLEFTAHAWSRVTGTEILEGYGLSETSPVLTSNRPDLEEYTGTIGLPLPNTDISLRDDAGQEVPNGEPGELCARGPQVMDGYWNDPEGTAKAMTSDGYFRTGDVAVIDADGYFRIVDRKKDMILVSAFNVYPNEVENVLTLHPDVVEAAVVGVPDGESGELVKAFVVKRAGSALTEQELRTYSRENLAAYKVPKQVEFRDTLPKSNVGKILRRALRDETA
ncbi:MAG: AMP-binding protein [Gammaproteobacteria bacterium]|nr:AMP-binding protein [Gammaproteobacteria bacterium]